MEDKVLPESRDQFRRPLVSVMCGTRQKATVMTKNRNYKRRVRDLMAATGENYTRAARTSSTAVIISPPDRGREDSSPFRPFTFTCGRRRDTSEPLLVSLDAWAAPHLLLTGPVGGGKSRVAELLADAFRAHNAGRPHQITVIGDNGAATESTVGDILIEGAAELLENQQPRTPTLLVVHAYQFENRIYDEHDAPGRAFFAAAVRAAREGRSTSRHLIWLTHQPDNLPLAIDNAIHTRLHIGYITTTEAWRATFNGHTAPPTTRDPEIGEGWISTPHSPGPLAVTFRGA